jgi:hypothetical protein
MFRTSDCSSSGGVLYRGADKSLARPTYRCILLDGENMSFDVILYIYIYIYIYTHIYMCVCVCVCVCVNSTNIPPIMITNRIYENLYLLSL